MPAAASSSRSTPPASRRAAAHPKPRLAHAQEDDGSAISEKSQQHQATRPAGPNSVASGPLPTATTTTSHVFAASGQSESDLIAALFSECDALDDLARAHGLSLRALIEWAERRDVIALRRSMRELADDRADLIVSRARTLAAHRLRTLVSSASSEETSRKACVDLLRIRRGTAPAEPAQGPSDHDPADSDDDDLLARLDAIALATNDLRERGIAASSQDHEPGPAGAD